MGLNYEAVSNYKIGGSGGVKEWFRPKPNDDGSARRFTVRLVMDPAADIPFFDTQIHYFRSPEGFTSGACPRVKGEFCLACDMFFRLRQLPQFTSDNSLKQLLRKISPSTRVYTNLIPAGVDRVQIWSMPYGVATDLRNAVLTFLEDGVDLTDPETGHDLTFSVSKQGAVQQYGSVTARPRASEVEVEDWESQLHDLEAKAHGRMFSADDAEEQVEKVLGESYAELRAEYDVLAAADRESSPAASTGEVGEAV